VTARTEPAPPPGALVAAFAAIYLCWGATFLAIRYAVADIPPLLTIAIRCAAGGMVLLVWLGVRGRLVPVPASLWWRIAAAGTLLFLGCHGLLAWAEQRVTSGEAALFMAGIPLWLVSLDAVLTGRLPPAAVIAGLALGVFGMGVLASGNAAAGGNADSSGGVLERVALLVSDLCWAAGSMVGRDRQARLPVAQTTALQLMAGSIVVMAASSAAGELGSWSPVAVSGRAIGAMAFLVLGGTVLGFGAYSWLLRVASPAAVGTYAFVNPVVALGLAALFGDGTITGRGLVAAVLVVAGVAAIWAGTRRAATAAAAAPPSHRGAGQVPRAAGAAADLRPPDTRVPPAASEAAG
jgi:drug/metabolite transporter (DMT)-like permease